jgi:two-component system chemotaxis response regulator CheB
MGMLEMKQAAAFTIAQDESTSVVFGMPREAILLNAVDRVLPLDQIPNALLERLASLSPKHHPLQN